MQDIIEILVRNGAAKVVQFGSSVWRSKYRDIDIFAEMPQNEGLREAVMKLDNMIDLHYGSSWDEFKESLGIDKYLVLYTTNQEEAQCL